MKALLVGTALLSIVCAAATATDSPSSSAARSHDECVSLFKQLDKDADGRISHSEASADPVIAGAFESFKLGDAGYLSADEFIVVCEHGPAPAQRRS